MEETLIIKNFGPIESVELKLKRFTVLIGEQGTEKSTVAKVLAVCRYFSYIIPSQRILDFFKHGLKAWGLLEHIRENKTYIKYVSEDYTFEAKHVLEEVYQVEGSEYEENTFFKTELKSNSLKFSQLLSELEKIDPEKDRFFRYYVVDNRNIPTSFFLNDVARVMSNPFFLPVERGLQSVFSLGKSTIQNISDNLFNQLAKLDQVARTFKELTSIQPLGIEYKNENGKGFIKLKDERFFSLYNGASGYQSTIPVVLSVEYYSKEKRSKTFIVEEPELNLFPIAQNKLMMYLVDKSIIYNHQMLLTTHSPYILTSLNNLLYAYQIGKEYPNEINPIVDKKYWLNPAEVSAYRLLLDGTAKNIMDDELKQIDTGELDEVSRELNGIWDKIADIEFSSIHEH